MRAFNSKREPITRNQPYVTYWVNKKGHQKWKSHTSIEKAVKYKTNIGNQNKRITVFISKDLSRATETTAIYYLVVKQFKVKDIKAKQARKDQLKPLIKYKGRSTIDGKEVVGWYLHQNGIHYIIEGSVKVPVHPDRIFSVNTQEQINVKKNVYKQIAEDQATKIINLKSSKNGK